jgi:phage shock protein E
MAATGAVVVLSLGMVACNDDGNGEPQPAEVTEVGPTTAPPATTDDGEPIRTDPDEGEDLDAETEPFDGADDEGARGRSAAGGVAPDGRVELLTSAEAAALLEEKPRTLVIDVRSLDEYMSGHLVGAQNIDIQDADLWDRRVEPLDRDRPTIVYCRTGRRSADAARKLVTLGFAEVYDLGGIGDWDEGDLPVDR